MRRLRQAWYPVAVCPPCSPPPPPPPPPPQDQFISVWKLLAVPVSYGLAGAVFAKYGMDSRGLMPVMVRRGAARAPGDYPY